MFGTIAPLYAKLDHKIIQAYERAISTVNTEINIQGKTILDIGTGSGAWAVKFVEKGARDVHGVDLSETIIKSGRIKHPEIHFSVANAENLEAFSDHSFDIVTASFVVHGVKAKRRAQMLQAMKRVAKEQVILHDFVGKTPVFLRFLEFLEKSDYKNFKANICTEIQRTFGNCKKVPVDFGSGIYFAKTDSSL